MDQTELTPDSPYCFQGDLLIAGGEIRSHKFQFVARVNFSCSNYELVDKFMQVLCP
jgi:hypothetical protein